MRKFKPGLIGQGKLDPVTGEFSLDLLRPSRKGENLIVEKIPPKEGSVVVLEADYSTGVIKVLRR